MEKGTLRELFRISLKAEREARSLYEGLAGKFSDYPEAREFFVSLISDEANHIIGLARLFDSLPAEELDKPAPARALAIAENFINFSAAEIIKQAHTLGDAYRETVKIEFSELNKLHELLFEIGNGDASEIRELQSVLRSHLNKVSSFRNSGIDLS